MTKLVKFQILAIFFIFQSNLFAQSASDKISFDFKAIGKDAENVWQNIGSMDGNDYAIAGALTGGVALAFLADEPIRDFFKDNHSKTLDKYFDIVNWGGEPITAATIAGGLYLGGLAFNDNYTRTTGRLVFESCLLAGLTTTTIKVVAGRARPFNEMGNTEFKWAEFEDRYNSFPSGHTTMAFAIATTLAGRIDKWWAYGGLYTLALSTGAARIYKDKHWFSDVCFGAVIGTVSALAVLKADKMTEKNNDDYSKYALIINGSQYKLISFVYKF